ncbi:autotransporter domain-containing protein [Pseudomonas sp. HR96]|uniref:autotransporter outer membrane beta-barrel domain-containing protein n=1 Tax=Pseudomonas sp. HR96 TaxID=1027966 RepID=UPI002A74D9D6|nr:autotransporter domain-containing protein [Pseudomonas sp. HR96]WPO99980.1 autotransporter domain-containing protein [Pseudomonas sp. HR96]
MPFARHRLAFVVALITAAGYLPSAVAQAVIISGASGTALNLTGSDSLTVTASGTLSNAGKAVTLKDATSGVGVVIDNSGQIRSSGGRAIDSNGSVTQGRNYLISNRSGALIEGYDDALRINSLLPSGSVVIDNSGTIHSATGQGLDLDALRGGTTTTVYNRLGGLIHGDASDGIKTGANAALYNWGEISTGDSHTDSDKFDGVDVDSASNVTIYNHGLISGGRHGITADNDATLYNDGTVIGRNGSGFGSDGNGSVVNHGLISGDYSGLKANGDGDGVDIDLVAHIENYGTIRGTGAGGVDKNGFTNHSEGIAIGGGYVYNAAGALVSGADNAMLVDDGSSGGGVAATHLENYGTIEGRNGFGVQLKGDFADSVINGGLISGSNGLALDLGGGDDSLTLRSASRFVGLVDGGSGYDQLILDDAAGGSFGASQNFEWLKVASGSWTLTGAGDFGSGGEVLGGARLNNLGGIAGTLTVDNGGVYAGGGTVGNLVVNGTMLTNSTLGTAKVTGNLTLGSGATLAYGVNADGSSAPVVVGGTAALNGATLEVQPSPGQYPWQNRYTVLQAGAVSGTFGQVTSDYAFLTPSLSYSATQVNLDYKRNDVAFADLATSTSAASAARSLTRLGSGSTLYNALLNTSTASAGGALQQLAASSNASLGSATQAGTAQVGSSMLAAMRQLGSGAGMLVGMADQDTPQLAATGVPAAARNLNDPNALGRLWLQGLGSYGKLDGENGGSSLQQRTRGSVLGLDWALTPDWRLGVLGGYSRTELDASGMSGQVDSWHLGAYALHQAGPLALRLGAAYSGNDGSSKRSVAFNGFSDTPRGDYHGNSQQAFAELGYAMGSGRLSAEPFANLGYQRNQRDGYREKGGAAALDVDSQTQDNFTSTFGLRLAQLRQLANGMSLTPRASLGWRHAYGDVDTRTRQAFIEGGSAFNVQGSALDRDSLMIEAGLDLGLTARQSLGLGYDGEIGSNSRNHAVVGEYRLRF